MKKLILWLIKVFKVDIPTEKIVKETVVREVKVPVWGQSFDGTIEGNVLIKGNVIVKGNLLATGDICAYAGCNAEIEYKEKEVLYGSI